ncbi:HAD family hydrolase [Rhabdochlamydiaceae symbiont of Dictyostelium giganteum]|uniref:HAD family hydrolase n=1 Tax=Rhabdochlamydiaceae symbiont of Dictyostelium giganteum TaxID=3342349 RepID=UPI00384F815C
MKLKGPKTPSSRLAVFDLDRTLISVVSSSCYMKNLYQKRLVSFVTVLKAVWIKVKYMLTSMSLEELHHQVFNKLVKGFSIEALEYHVEEFVNQLLPSAIYKPAFQELQEAKERGDYIALISSAPDFLVRAFATYFNISHWESTVYAVNQKKQVCDIAKLMVGSTKKRSFLKLKKQLGLAKDQTAVYSDSHDDLPLFFQAGHPVAVNPDRKLAKVARQLNWRII